MPPAEASRILVVDDEPSIVDTLVMILHVQSYNARGAYTAEQAIEIAEQFKPHAVVSDVMLPGMNGIELADWFGDHQPECKVLLVSGHLHAFQMAEDAMHTGRYYTMLSKPLHPTRILEFLSSCTSVL